MSEHKIEFSQAESQLDYFRQKIIADTVNGDSLFHQSEAAYQLKSLLLGINRFLNNEEYDADYITEKLGTLHRIVLAHKHDKAKGYLPT